MKKQQQKMGSPTMQKKISPQKVFDESESSQKYEDDFESISKSQSHGQMNSPGVLHEKKHPQT